MATIYALTCTVNGKAYIGCTAGNIAKRFREHRCLLTKGTHSEKDLLADLQRFGASCFRMEVVYVMDEDAPVKTKRAMETFAMQRYKAQGLLYNRNEASFAPTREAILKSRAMNPNKGRVQTTEEKLRRSIAQLGIPKGHGAKISATKRAQRMMR